MDNFPRTRHRDGDAPRFTNRLIAETSPYLRQHAHNPVDWYPWGDAAFAEARRTQRPVFLSVGYSTCHWCHVMEEESFEDLAVARVLNERYVAIKVDREERPDVDAVYMTAVQALSGRGGWPMSVWLDAERRPFFAGTYFPARDGERGATKGFITLLRELADIYRAEPGRVADAAESITAAIRQAMAGTEGAAEVPGAEVLDAAARWCTQAYDDVFGGTRGAPKFPSSFPVRVLLRQHRRTGDRDALAMAVHTLESIAAGGIHDQLGGGFHRYATDSRWLVPHFEKMLYDNALLALAYAEAYQATGRADFARVLCSTLDYVLREMRAPDGGFYSATDADSEGEEGRFFVWHENEIRAALGAGANAFIEYYGVTEQGNFEGCNVLFVPRPDENACARLAPAREALRLLRETRPHPSRDEKILAAWNGLMISALAFGSSVTGESRYAAAAVDAAGFVLGDLTLDGRVQRSRKDGRCSGPGFLEDDAFVTAAFLDCYDATLEREHLAAALALATRTEELFADRERGGWFRTASDHETLLAREKPSHDGAEPSGASVALANALRLHALTGDDGWRRIAERALGAYGPILRAQPAALHEMLLALDRIVDRVPEIVLVWPRGEDATGFREHLRRRFLPNRALVGAAEGPELGALAELVPFARDKVALDGKATAYVCERGACRLPTTDPAEMDAQLATLGG